MEPNNNQRKKEMDKATWWGLITNVLLSAGKLFVGFTGHSQALIADGLHSLSDLLSDGMVLLATHHSNIDADDDHPYGHARYETFATIALATLLASVGIGISIDAINHLINYRDMPIPSPLTLMVAALSVLSKEILYQYTIRVAKQVKSKLLEANAWHHRSDAISSIIVFIGIAGAIWGYPLLDSIAALIVALMICKIAWDLGLQSFQELVDTGLEPDTLKQMKKTILAVDGVNQMHMLRTRRMGHSVLADVHILVSPKLSVSEGHQISEAVESALVDKFDEVNDITVHIDPEDDEHAENSCKHLPLRTEILTRLSTLWGDIPETLQYLQINLHYLDGRIDIELILPLEVIQANKHPQQLKQDIEKASHALNCIGHIDILYK